MDEKACARKEGVWNPNRNECVIRKRGKDRYTRREVWQVLSEVEGDLVGLFPRNRRVFSTYFNNFEL